MLLILQFHSHIIPPIFFGRTSLQMLGMSPLCFHRLGRPLVLPIDTGIAKYSPAYRKYLTNDRLDSRIGDDLSLSHAFRELLSTVVVQR